MGIIKTHLVPILLISCFMLLFILFLYIEKDGSNKQIINNKVQEIKIQNEVIEESKQITVRKTVNKSFSSNDNLEWLYKNRCKDCESK